ncbi:proteoglycan Cow [Ostrinia nubilalis]|uniref:proteoglycan Cow n=1 Tax=Ostrinia nubilalis TaxID=29057 RepID=UPI0030825774
MRARGWACAAAAAALLALAAAAARRADQDFEFDDDAVSSPPPPPAWRRPGPFDFAAASGAQGQAFGAGRLRAHFAKQRNLDLNGEHNLHTKHLDYTEAGGGGGAGDAGRASDAGRAGDAGRARRPRRYMYDPHNTLCQSLVCKRRDVCLLKDTYTAFCANKKEILRKGDVIVAQTVSASEETSGGWARVDDEDVFYDAGADAPEPDADAPDRCVGCPVRARAEFLCGSDNRTYSSLCRLDLHNCVRRAARPVRLACRGFCPCREPERDWRKGERDRSLGGTPVTPERGLTDVADARSLSAGPGREPHRGTHAPPRGLRRQRGRQRASRRNFDEYEDEWRRRKQDPEHNEVLPERPARRRQGSEGCALDKMANRLLDWFSVLMEEAGATAGPEDGFPSDCKPEVRWMFAHLDTDGDGVLSATNLYSLRHDERERCLRPFLSSCGGADGADAGGVSRAAWCGCLRRAARPCAALARAHPAPRPGAYVPACDARGFYRPRQCHAALGVCWCVDAHGAELPGSRTKGAPACGPRARPPRPPAPAAPPEGAPADDEDAPGSGDAELRF